MTEYNSLFFTAIISMQTSLLTPGLCIDAEGTIDTGEQKAGEKGGRHREEMGQGFSPPAFRKKKGKQ